MTDCLASTEIERHPWQGVVIALVGLVVFLIPTILPQARWQEKKGASQCQLAWARVCGVLLLLFGAGLTWLELNK